MARADLIAFARGHSEAVATIHQAVLHALGSDSFEAMLTMVVRDWPALLDVDLVVVAVVIGGAGYRIDRSGVTLLAPGIIGRMNATAITTSRAVERGHALFGPDAASVRAEAAVPILADAPGLPHGLLMLGHCTPVEPGSAHGAQLLEFLGQFLAAMMRRWLSFPPTTEPTRRAL